MTRGRAYAAWAATRVVVTLLLAVPRIGPSLRRDLKLYERWGNGIADWSAVPYRDFAWEYPPGAALAVTPPAFLGDWYTPAFVLLMLLADLAVLAVLLRLAERLGSYRGVWLWVAGVALMGPIVHTRYDVASALLAVLAAAAMAGGAGVAAGVALGGGVVTKLWPALLLVAVPLVPDRRRLLVAAGATVAATVLAVLAAGGAAHGGATFGRHSARGLQVESVAATPVVVAHRLGAGVAIDFYESSGSWDVTGPGVAAALAATSLLTAVALALAVVLLLRARRAPEVWPDLAAATLLMMTVAGKVLSPQYLVWVLALLAVALCRPASSLGRPAALVGACGVLSLYVYPVYYGDLINGGGAVVVAVLALRNALLVAATVLAVRSVWRATR